MMHYICVAVLGLAFAGLGYDPTVIFGAMTLLAISLVMGELHKQRERLTVALREHSEPQLERIEDGHTELGTTLEQLRKELAAATRQLHVMTGELLAVRVSLAGKPKGPWEP